MLTLCACLAVGLIAAHFAYRLWRPKLGWLAARLPTRRLALGTAIALATAYAYQVSSFHLLHHRNLGTGTFDLGLYANIFWQSAHGNLLGCSFLTSGSHVQAHFSPILVLLSPLYWLAPRAETLLVLQSVWLSSAVIPLFLIAENGTRRAWMGLLLSAVYLLYPALHGVDMYDFHSLTLCVPIVLWAIFLLETGRLGWYWPVLFLLLLTREDMPLLACFLGLYAVLERRATGLGVGTVAVSLVYLAVVKLLVMKGASGYANYFSDLDARGARGVPAILWSLVTNPQFALAHMLSQKKVLYALKLLLPLLLTPLFSGRMCLLFVYGFTITLLATRWALYNLAYQYSVLVFPFLFAAAPKGLERLVHSRLARALDLQPARLRAALGTGMLVCCLLISESYGVFWQNDAFRAGPAEFKREPTERQRQRYALVQKMAALIPPHASVAASSKLGSHFASRDRVFSFPAVRDSEYVVYWSPDVKKKRYRRGFAKFRKAKTHKAVIKRHGIRLYRRVYSE